VGEPVGRMMDLVAERWTGWQEVCGGLDGRRCVVDWMAGGVWWTGWQEVCGELKYWLVA
jgi:hypothetical protein